MWLRFMYGRVYVCIHAYMFLWFMCALDEIVSTIINHRNQEHDHSILAVNDQQEAKSTK
jgi:hypothetical protein